MGLLLQMFNGMLAFFNNLRPAWQPTIPEDVSNFIAMLRGYNEIFPVAELAFVFSLLLSFMVVLLITKSIQWIAENLPTGG